MKRLKTIIILIVLFGLPAGSWYFLKSGFQWRKDKLESLESKGNFIKSIGWDENEKESLFKMMSYKTTVVQTKGKITESEQTIIDQFRKSPTFQWLLLTRDTSANIKYSSKDPRKFFTSNNFNNQSNPFASSQYMIIDTAIHIRSVYQENDVKSLSKLVEDIALVLPRKKNKDIGVKKKSN